jgi:Zn-dependent protease/CBS domain-containing protein
MMGWSISLGRIAGTEVRIHLTFFLLLAWFGLVAASSGGAAAGFAAVGFIVAVFACVLAHEYGHVLMARRFGIGTKDIILLPIGGVASIERMPDNPTQELLIALAGPAVNVVIAFVLIVFFGASFGAAESNPAVVQNMDFVSRLAMVNILLVVFNLLPAFPMDGGRALRALLAYKLDKVTATRVAARIGQAAAFGLGFLGLFGNPLLIFIALFVFLAAGQEAYAVELGDATKRATMRDATITSFAHLDTNASVSQGVTQLLGTSQREFPVTDGGGRLRGVLTRDGIIRALSSSGPDTPVLDVMERDIPTIDYRAPLSEAADLLHGSGKPLVGVVDENQRVIGIITLENLAEFMLVDQANQGWRRSQPNLRAGGERT